MYYHPPLTDRQTSQIHFYMPEDHFIYRQRTDDNNNIVIDTIILLTNNEDIVGPSYIVHINKDDNVYALTEI